MRVDWRDRWGLANMDRWLGIVWGLDMAGLDMLWTPMLRGLLTWCSGGGKEEGGGGGRDVGRERERPAPEPR